MLPHLFRAFLQIYSFYLGYIIILWQIIKVFDERNITNRGHKICEKCKAFMKLRNCVNYIFEKQSEKFKIDKKQGESRKQGVRDIKRSLN